MVCPGGAASFIRRAHLPCRPDRMDVRVATGLAVTAIGVHLSVRRGRPTASILGVSGRSPLRARNSSWEHKRFVAET